MNEPTTLDRLRAVIDAHGATPSRWPAGERTALQALVSGSQEARAVFDDASRLARVLDDESLQSPSPALRRAILARAPQPRKRFSELLAEFWAMLGGARLAAPAFAVALAIGTTLGAYGDFSSEAGDEADIDLVDVAQLSTEYPEL